jgi:thiol-disulfide isomerase/thioredoxin
MEQDVIFRLLLTLALISGGVSLYWLVNRVLIRRASSNRIDLPSYQPGIPAILYFTTPECAPCKTVQRPAIQWVKERFGDKLSVVEVNAQERPDLASEWGVLSVPTTFILDPEGKTRHINHGVTRADKLMQQVAEFEDYSI